MMKYIIILTCILLTSCKNIPDCQKKISRVLNPASLITWEKVTSQELSQLKDPRLLFLQKSEKEKRISIFDRSRFINCIFFRNKSLDSILFTKSIIIELNNSGEVNQKYKFLLLSCGNETEVIKFSLIVGKWQIVEKFTKGKKDVSTCLKKMRLISKTLNQNSNNIDEVGCISEFLPSGKVEVIVFGKLNNIQSEGLEILKK